MIVEYTWSEHELKCKKCYKCKFLQMQDAWDGKCVCETNKVKIKQRSITDKCCTSKVFIQESEGEGNGI